MNRHGIRDLQAALAALILGFFVVSANAAGVMVGNLDDSNGDATLFTGAVTQSGAQGEEIAVGLMDFMASDSNGTGASALDTLFMTIYAPAGYLITSVALAERGYHNTNGSGVTISTGSIVVGGTAVSLPTSINQDTSGIDVEWTAGANVPVANLESVDVSLVNSLTAVGADATVWKDTVSLTVGLAAVPLPPAIWMLGAAIAGLVSVGRRKLA